MAAGTAVEKVSNSKELAVIAEIEKKFGKGNIFKFSDKPRIDIPVASTGIIGLDHALGIGGIPYGRITEIFGNESSGKTSIALKAAASCQRDGGRVAYVDAENALDINHARLLGVDVDDMYISQPDTAENIFGITEELVKSGDFKMVVIDSVAALVSQREFDGEFGDSNVGVIAKLMSQACRKLTPLIAKNEVSTIFINQIREKIGVMFGNPETTTGGRALKFFSTLRIETSASTKVKDGDAIVGSRMKAKVVKNKLAPPFLNCEYQIMFGHDVSKYYELVELGAEYKILNKSGAWYSYGDSRVGQGLANSVQFLIDNPLIADELEAKIRTELGVA